MAKVEIIKAPPGGAPQEIRDAWLNLYLQIDDSEIDEDEQILFGVDGGEPQNEGGYRILMEEALKVLADSDQAAEHWWRDHFPILPMQWLVFHKDACRYVEKLSLDELVSLRDGLHIALNEKHKLPIGTYSVAIGDETLEVSLETRVFELQDSLQLPQTWRGININYQDLGQATYYNEADQHVQPVDSGEETYPVRRVKRGPRLAVNKDVKPSNSD